jgi:hypothetical protein
VTFEALQCWSGETAASASLKQVQTWTLVYSFDCSTIKTADINSGADEVSSVNIFYVKQVRPGLALDHLLGVVARVFLMALIANVCSSDNICVLTSTSQRHSWIKLLIY